MTAKTMHFVAILAYWLLFSAMFSETYTIEFRGETVLANRADSLAGEVRADLATLDSLREVLDRRGHVLDSLFLDRWPQDAYYMKEKAKVARFRERLDSLARVRQGELEGLE